MQNDQAIAHRRIRVIRLVSACPIAGLARTMQVLRLGDSYQRPERLSVRAMRFSARATTGANAGPGMS